jgi:hypothetical protein
MRFRDKGSGYSQIKKQRPQTLGYGLKDSPIGQAAWIYEKCLELAGDGISGDDVLSFDEVLDNITLYWLTATATSAAHARQRPRSIGLLTLNTWMIGNIGTSTRVSLSKAPVRDDDMESVDDQIQVSWPGSNSVSGDSNAGSCRGGSRDQTLVGAGRSPSTARRRYSPIRISADS